MAEPERTAPPPEPGPRPGSRPRPSQIRSPIPLLAFLGAVVEGIIAVITYSLRDALLAEGLFFTLVVAMVALPVLLIAVIFVLITRHHGKLYAPADFERQEDFLRILEQTRPVVERVARSNRQDQYRPFRLTRESNSEDVKLVGQHADRWRDLLESMTAEEFIALHSWYNETGQDSLALLCIDIAISRGMMTSKNFSFRSANLRHLGRLIEARHSAELALELDATNSDAHYNLAKLLLQMGRRAEAEKHARRTLEGDAGAYAARLRPLFPDLVAAERREGGP